MEAVKNLVKVLVKPSKVFEWVRENPSWWLPALILVVAAVIVAVVGAPLGTEDALKQNADKLSPEQLEQSKQMLNSPLMGVIAAVSSFFVVIFSILIQSALLHLGASMFGGRAKFTAGIATVAYASMPIVLQQITQSIYMSASGNIVKPGLSSLLPSDQVSSPFAAFLGRIDIFSAWSIILLIIGFSITYKISKGKAATIAIGYWLIATIVAVALAIVAGGFTPPA